MKALLPAVRDPLLKKERVVPASMELVAEISIRCNCDTWRSLRSAESVQLEDLTPADSLR